MRAADFMTKDLATVREDATLAEAAKLMLDRRIGSVLVVDDAGNLRGIVTESDFVARDKPLPFSLFQMPRLFGQWIGSNEMEAVYKEAGSIRVGDVMRKKPVTAGEDATLEDIAEAMARHDVKHVTVVRQERPVGMVSRHDLLRAVAGRGG